MIYDDYYYAYIYIYIYIILLVYLIPIIRMITSRIVTMLNIIMHNLISLWRQRQRRAPE